MELGSYFLFLQEQIKDGHHHHRAVHLVRERECVYVCVCEREFVCIISTKHTHAEVYA